jgi:hypothetical protein
MTRIKRVTVGSALALAGCVSSLRTTYPHADAVPDGFRSASASDISLSPSEVTLAPLRSSSPDTLWTIERGSYAGTTVPLRFDAATSARGAGEHFLRLSSRQANEAGVVGWPSGSYPIPVAFRRNRWVSAITPADSMAFWQTLDGMNADLGLTVFRPETVKKGADPEDVVIVDLRDMADRDGFSRMSWSSVGELSDVRVTFRDASLLHNSHVVAHELMHALGFGHTTAWKSVVNPRDAYGLPRLTPEDVAYAEVAMHSRESHERADMRKRIALAVEREAGKFRSEEGYALCGSETTDSFANEETMRYRGLLPIGLLTVVWACGNKGNEAEFLHPFR